jgi:hypothetical protein
MRLTIIGNKGDPFILTIAVAIFRHDEASGLHDISCHSALRIGKTLFLIIISDTAIIVDVVAHLTGCSIVCGISACNNV